jgi:hypothetical protein
MSDRHEPGTLIGTSPGIRLRCRREDSWSSLYRFFSDGSDENRPLNNKNQGKKAEKRPQVRKFG